MFCEALTLVLSTLERHSFLFVVLLSRTTFRINRVNKANGVQECCREYAQSKEMYASLCLCAFFFLQCVYSTHKSLFNAFPRSDLVRGNVVTHLICGPSA